MDLLESAVVHARTVRDRALEGRFRVQQASSGGGCQALFRHKGNGVPRTAEAASAARGCGAGGRVSAEAGVTGAGAAGFRAELGGGAPQGGTADGLTQRGRVETENGLFVQGQLLDRSLLHWNLLPWSRRLFYMSY